jgi:hypothetical protein
VSFFVKKTLYIQLPISPSSIDMNDVGLNVSKKTENFLPLWKTTGFNFLPKQFSVLNEL